MVHQTQRDGTVLLYCDQAQKLLRESLLFSIPWILESKKILETSVFMIIRLNSVYEAIKWSYA